MPTTTKPGTVTISDDAIRQRAYYLWEADGRPDGRSEHYWHLASAEAAHMQPAPAPKPKAEKPAKAAAKPAAKPKAVAEKPAKATRRAAAPA